MSSITEYTDRFILYDDNLVEFNFKEENFKKNIDHYIKWKDTLIRDVYENDSHFSIEWEFLLNEEEKINYSNNSEDYKRKSILLFEIQLFVCLFDYIEKNFDTFYPVLWKDKVITYDYFYDLYPKIKVNIEIRDLLSNIRRLYQYYLSDKEKERLLSIKKSIEILQNKIHKRMIHIELYMKLFYKTDFQKINSYDIRREILSYL